MGIRNYLKRRREDKKELEPVLPPDGGWGWVVCAAAFLIQFVVLGTMNNFGILYVKLFENFGRKAFLTSLIGSINYGIMFFNGPIAAAMAAKYGCRSMSMIGSIIFSLGFLLSSYAKNIVTLYFTYGVMVGFGASLCYFSSLVAVGQYFYTKLSLANGIISSGSGIGTLVMGPVMNNLLKQLGWRDTLCVYAGMSALIFLSAILYRPINSSVVQHDKNSKKEPEKAKFIDFSIFRNKAYVIWCVALSIFILGYFVPFVHLVKYAQNNGVSEDDSSFLIGIMSLGSTFGRLFFGPLSDHPKVNRLYVYQLSILCMGISNTLLPLMKTHATIVCYCVVWGTFEGCYVALCAVLTADIVGRNKLSSGVGVLFGIKSIPLTGGPALAGAIYDISKSYDVAFYIAGAVCTLCCCIMFLIPLNMPEAGEEVVDSAEPEDIERKALKENGSVGNGKLENGRRSDDSAYVSDQPSAIVLLPRPQSSYLSPYRDQHLVVSPSTLSIRRSLSRSTASLAHRYLEPIAKKVKSSEFGSMVSIPIIPNSGTYRSLQQIPVTTSSVDLHHTNQDTSTPNVNNAPQERRVPVDIPTIVIGDNLPGESFHNSTEDINENIKLISNLPGKETNL